MSLSSALRALRQARSAETARAQATPDAAKRSDLPEASDTNPVAGDRGGPHRPPDLPSAEDSEQERWRKLLALRTGSGMGSVIWDAARPRGDAARGDDRALIRDGFSRRVWRE